MADDIVTRLIERCAGDGGTRRLMAEAAAVIQRQRAELADDIVVRRRERASAMEVFNEYTLLADIIERWGEYGAHADLMRWMIAEIERLRAEVARLGAFMHPIGEQARRG